MIGKITLCDVCKEASHDTKADSWVLVSQNGITQYSSTAETAPYSFKVPKALDFCSWRCFRKYWRGFK